MALTWEQHQQNIFSGESGGDYDALFGYQNRPNGAFAGIKVSEMPVGDVVRFTSPTGKYGQYVKGQVGRVATPVGAYQVVGTTLRDAVKALGIDPEQKFDKATQDKIGQYILKTQGTGAWEGYGKGGASMADQPTQPQQPQGLLGGILGGQGIGGALGLSDDFRDRLKMGILLGSDPQRFAPMVSGIQARGKERRAAARTTAQANATADYLERIGQTDAANLLRQGAISAADALNLGKSKNTALIRNALAAGLKEGTPEFQRFILSGGDIFSQKTAILANLPPPEKGMRYDFVEDEMGNITSYRLVPITGSKADKEAEDIQRAADASRKAQSTSGMVVLEDIGKALEIAKESPILSTGFIGGVLKDIGGTPAKNLTALTTTIKANIGFDRLQRMREESPTGGALGQVAVQELEALQSTLGSLDNSQTNAQFVGNLERLEAQYQKSMQEIYNAAIKDQAEGKINKKTGRVISPMDYFSESDIQKLSGGVAGEPSATTASSTVTHRFNPETGKVEPVR